MTTITQDERQQQKADFLFERNELAFERSLRSIVITSLCVISLLAYVLGSLACYLLLSPTMGSSWGLVDLPWLLFCIALPFGLYFFGRWFYRAWLCYQAMQEYRRNYPERYHLLMVNRAAALDRSSHVR